MVTGKYVLGPLESGVRIELLDSVSVKVSLDGLTIVWFLYIPTHSAPLTVVLGFSNMGVKGTVWSDSCRHRLRAGYS